MTRRSGLSHTGLAAQLALGMAAGTSMQFVLAALGPQLISDLGLDPSSLGLLHTAYFAVAAAASTVLGRLTDRIGGARLFRLMCAWQGAALLTMSATGSLAGLCLAALLSGVAAAGSNPTTNTIAMKHVPPASRGTVMGVKQSGPWLAAVVSGSLLVPLATAVHWRIAVAVAAGLVWVLAAVPVAVRGRVGAPGPAPATHTRRPVPLGVLPLVPYAFLLGSVASGISSYLAVFAVDLGFSDQHAGLALAGMGLSAIVGRVAWGHLATRWTGPVSPLATIALLSAPAVGLLAMASSVGSASTVWMAAVLVGVTAMSWNSVGMFQITRMVPDDVAGHVSGLVLTGFFVGLLTGPLIITTTLRLTATYTLAWATLAALCLVAATLASRGRSLADVPDPMAMGDEQKVERAARAR